MNIADSIMAMAHCKYVTVNTDNMKLVLGISAKIRSNYFSLIDVPDCSAPAATTCRLRAAPAPPTAPAATTHRLHAAPAPPTTAAAAPPPPPPPTTASLPPPGAVRVSAHQIAGIRAPVQFTKLVLEEQEKEKEEKEKKEKKKKK
ncbi:uncharacterized protein CIMG_13114 [Coccidioides immitis RS]|uniref:Uncharacterized protein n=1 Tax=Coccidioides immitis (strain RS) TaxID=246410 RepID=J3K9R0_COCIM|nr:uncharacterized protein CIMG_13114 [Coccidioides immitis RS]EAS31679.3 hypothetical protein CIMG_13114 [Coccidioides immitis RS]